MANMTFKASLIPNSDYGYSLGSNTSGSEKRWNIYGNLTGSVTGNATTATRANLTTTQNALAYYSDTSGTFGDSFIIIDTTNKTIAGFINGGQKSGTTLGTRATAEGYNTTASGNYSHAEGGNTTASGNYSHAEGCNTTASKNYSHAEGDSTTASGSQSHAEGFHTTASGSSSHAEGCYTTASRNYSHAEGHNTTASGNYSHAEGQYTTAQRKSQHVFGEYNILDTGGTDGTTRGTYVEIVGKGTGDNARSNARTLDWSGNESLAGNLLPMVTNTKDLGSSSLKWANVYATNFNGNASSATAANLTTTANAIAYYTNTTGTFGTKASANGALYATAANGALQWGTLPVAQGGTGKTSWTQGGILYASGTGTLVDTGAGTTGYLLQSNGTSAPSWIQATESNVVSTIVKRNATTGYIWVGGIEADGISLDSDGLYSDDFIIEFGNTNYFYGNATSATNANLTTVANNLAYYSNTSGKFAAIANNSTTTKKFLSQTNSGTPTWEAVTQHKKFTNISVPTSAWVNSSAYTGYAKQASITCSEITSDWIPTVIFNPADAISGNFAPICNSGSGQVIIYAKTAPTVSITIPLIKCEYI